jgi:3-oxoacyl-[acyl-carrier protein] reductase
MLDGKVAIVTGAGVASAARRRSRRAPRRDGDRERHRRIASGEAGRVPVAEVVRMITAAAGRGRERRGRRLLGSARGRSRAYDQYGHLDILVNNAGVLRDRMSFNMSEEEFDLVMRVHCKGHFAMTRHACERWRDQAKTTGTVYGRVINTSSEAGLMGSAGNANYSMAKAAIAALTVSIAREMGKYGVRSNFIAPRARTRMTMSMPNHAMFDEPESGFDTMHPAWPAELVAFLASEHVDFNGQGFIVWGGQVVLVQGWHVVNQITKDGAALTVEDLVKRKDELFGNAPKEPGYL